MHSIYMYIKTKKRLGAFPTQSVRSKPSIDRELPTDKIARESFFLTEVLGDLSRSPSPKGLGPADHYGNYDDEVRI